MKSTVFYILALALALTGCSKKEDAPPVPKSGIEMVAIGPINFGGLLVDSARDAAVRIYNYGPGVLDTTNLVFSQSHNNPSEPGLTPQEIAKIVLADPFKVQSVSAPCSSGSLAVGSSCVIAIRFFPRLPGVYSQDLKLCLDATTCTSITTTGRGMVGGVMSMDENRWDIGQTYAGIETRKTFRITNLGDYTIPAPTVTLIPGVTIGLNTCGSFIATQKTCNIELVAKKTAFGYTDENVIFNAGDGGTLTVRVENTVIAGPASGTITFQSPPGNIVADGSTQYTVTTQQIKDQYGNVVIDGSSVRISSGNATVCADPWVGAIPGSGDANYAEYQARAVPNNCSAASIAAYPPSPKTTVDGKVTFTFQSPTTKGFATISLLSGDANGFLRAVATAGPPSGVLEVQAYPASITANGNTQVVFKLLPVKDQFGNVVEDGQTIQFFLQGGGTLSASSNFTILGSTSVALTASSTVGSAIVQFRANPQYDNNNNIIGWGASGNYQIQYTPGIPAGTIPITANNPAIYAVEDQSYENQGIPIYSTITIGPVRDLTGNIVATNTPININVVGGRNVTFQNPIYPVTGYTDDTGKISMIMAGNGTRGYINISAQGQGGSTAYGAYNLWAFTESRYLPTNNVLDNRYTLFEAVSPGTTLPPLTTTNWAPYGSGDLFPMSANDGNTLTLINRNSTAINNFLTNLSYIQSPCWFTRGSKLQLGPCPVDEYKTNKASLAYDAVSPDGASVAANGPAHRPLLTLKNQHLYSSWDSIPSCSSYNSADCDNIRQGASFSTGTHDPVARGGWSNHYGSPVLGTPGFLPLDNTYIYFGGSMYSDGTDQFCPRVQANVCTINTYTTQAACQADTNAQWINSAQAQSTCEARSSCQWNVATLTCSYKTNTNLFGRVSDWASLYFNMDRINQDTTSTYQYGAMDDDQVGEYPPASMLGSSVNNGSELLFTFGGLDSGSNMAKNDLYILNANNKKWTMMYADEDPNERGSNGKPSPRYQHAMTYVKDKNSIFVGGGLRHYTCDEFITKSACLASSACTWDDEAAIEDVYESNSSSYLPAMNSLYGEYCKPVSQTVCNDIDPSLNPYRTADQGSATAQTECNKRLGCQWNSSTISCTLRSGANTSGGGWVNSQDFWMLDLNPLNDGDANTNPTWKKLCDSQEPYIGGDQSRPNPAYRSCGFPNGICSNINYTTQTTCQSAGGSWSTTFYPDISTQPVMRAVTSPLGSAISERHTNMVWNPLKNRIYFAWEGVNNILAYNPYDNTFSTPTGAAAGLANSYQLMFSPHTGKTFAYKRGTINSVNSTVKSFEMDPNERRYIRAEIRLGNGTKEFATTVKPIIRGSGNVGYCSNANYGSRGDCIIKGVCSNAAYTNTSQSSCNSVGASWTPYTWTMENQGISAYIYNYSTNQWVLIGSNTYIVQSSDVSGFANNEIKFEYVNQAARNLVSEDGKVNILIVPQGNPAAGRTQELNIESIAVEGRF